MPGRVSTTPATRPQQARSPLTSSPLLLRVRPAPQHPNGRAMQAATRVGVPIPAATAHSARQVLAACCLLATDCPTCLACSCGAPRPTVSRLLWWLRQAGACGAAAASVPPHWNGGQHAASGCREAVAVARSKETCSSAYTQAPFAHVPIWLAGVGQGPEEVQ